MSWLIPPKPHPLLLFSSFSLLFSVIYITHSNPLLLHFQSLSPSVTTPPSPCYPVSPSPVTTPCSFVTLSSLPLLLPPVLMLPSLLFPCYYPLFLCYPVSSSPVTTPCSFVTLSPFTLSPYTLLCKECLPVLSTGAFTLSKTRPFKHAEHAFLAPWRRPSCM